MTTKFNRLSPEDRRESILTVALGIAEKSDYRHLGRDELARAANVAAGLINFHFGTMANLKVELMRYAVAKSNVEVVAQGLLARDAEALKAPQALRSLAAGRVFDA